MLSPVACGSFSLAIAVAGAATADVTPTFVQVNATASELVAAGFDRSNNGLVSLSVQTASGSESAFAPVGSTQSSIPNIGYFDSQFVEFQSGQIAGLEALFAEGASAGWDRDALIKLISGQPTDSAFAGLPGEVTGEYSRFDLWLPGSSMAGEGGVVWLPNVGDTDVGARLSGSTGAHGDGEFAVGGMQAVPAPGVFALLGLAGLAGFRRRR